MLYKIVVSAVLTLLLSACSQQTVQSNQVSLPLLTGWHDGETVYYITTDVSDRDIAREKSANYAPRLADAVPEYPKPPQVKTALERVYAFPHQEQDRSVFASVPTPIGYQSTDRHYSPLWLLYVVTWKNPLTAYELTSEDAIFQAEDQGLITITRTNVVLNCPVIEKPKND